MKQPSVSRSPLLAALLALLLLGLGFVIGFGYHTLQRGPGLVPTATEPPLAKALLISPDDKLLAFTGVYDEWRSASRFLVDLSTGRFSAVESPYGWQDYMTQWNPAGGSILLNREKIPRPAAIASSGLYEEKIGSSQSARVTPSGSDASASSTAAPVPPELRQGEPEPLTRSGPAPGDKVTSGFWTPDGRLVVKTRRETRALYGVGGTRDEATSAQLLDRSPSTYYQHRAVTEHGKTVLYFVRDLPDGTGSVALYRRDNGPAQQVSDALSAPVWVYLAENARWMVICQETGKGGDWSWTLYQVDRRSVRLVKTGPVPADVVTVSWSPDFKYILGAGGKSLWLVEVPSLRVRQLGSRNDWNADDTAWMHHEAAVIVSSQGKLWKVAVPGGAAGAAWQFPARYWQEP